MPHDMVALLVRLLEQNNGALSNRAKEKEFKQLSPSEIAAIEENYKLIFWNWFDSELSAGLRYLLYVLKWSS